MLRIKPRLEIIDYVEPMSRLLNILAAYIKETWRVLALIALGLLAASVAFPFLETDYHFVGPGVAEFGGVSQRTVETFWSFKKTYYVKTMWAGELSTKAGDRWFSAFWSQTWNGPGGEGIGTVLLLIFGTQILTAVFSVMLVVGKSRYLTILPAISSLAMLLLMLFVACTLDYVYEVSVGLGFWFVLLSTVFYGLSFRKALNVSKLIASWRKRRDSP